MSDEMLLHYDNLAQFEETYFKDLLTQMHIVEHEKHIKEVNEKGNEGKVTIDEYMTILEKNNKKYLMPSKYVKDLPIKVVGKPSKYSLKGDVYYCLEKTNVVTARFKPVKTMSFKRLIDKLAGFEHSNPEQYKLLTMINFTQMLDRANFRISTPPSFGKDSAVDTMGALFGEAHTIENPTIAKLEMMTFAKLLAVNEVVDIAPAQWRDIELFLLSTGAFKNSVTKRSRAHGKVGEILDTSKLSLTLMYNDIDSYPSSTKYFDMITKNAVKDRFPPLRLHGVLTQDFDSIAKINVKDYVKENLNKYVDIIRAFHYYKSNLFNELHYYKYIPTDSYPERWKTNIGRLLKIVDVYSCSQEEFDKWAGVLSSAIRDYQEMLIYPDSLTLLAEKLRIPKAEFAKEPSLGYLQSLMRNRHKMTGDEKFNDILSYLKKIGEAKTFVIKNILAKQFTVGQSKMGVDKW